MSDTAATVSRPVFPLGLVLFLIFLILKLTDHIDWSWVWIFAPIWIPLSLVLVVCLAVIIPLAVSKQ